jgi:sodium/pantothenate symporter
MIVSWTLFALYVVGTLWLARLGQRRTTTFESYALGDRAMHPFVAGMALAATMTSTATLLINPGIVFAYGLSAVLGYGVSAGLGLALGIVVFSKAFRRGGVEARVLTVPQWIGWRWGDERLTLFYALVNLLLVAMVVLICYAMAGLLLATLGLDRLVPGWGFEVALAGIVAFVFAYVFVGGTFAHAYTNTFQGLLMLVVAVLLIASGAHLFDGHLLDRLAAIDPALATAVNPKSLLFRTVFEVFGANFLIGVALSLQPHFLIKALYVRTDRDVNRYLTLAIAAGVVFNLVLLCGLYARIERAPEVAAFMAQTGLGIDGVMPAYIVASFPPLLQSFIAVAILAAGMSTLDGILVALSAIFANDVVLVLRRRRGLSGDGTAAADAALAFRVGRYSLIGLGIAAFVLCLVQHGTKKLSIAIFAQEGVYALLVATFVPLLFGLFGRGLAKGVVVTASVVALAVHFGFRYGGITLLTAHDGTNPGLTAAYALLASLAVALVGKALFRPVPA